MLPLPAVAAEVAEAGQVPAEDGALLDLAAGADGVLDVRVALDLQETRISQGSIISTYIKVNVCFLMHVLYNPINYSSD